MKQKLDKDKTVLYVKYVFYFLLLYILFVYVYFFQKWEPTAAA
jgi:hypothetical protein